MYVVPIPVIVAEWFAHSGAPSRHTRRSAGKFFMLGAGKKEEGEGGKRGGEKREKGEEGQTRHARASMQDFVLGFSL